MKGFVYIVFILSITVHSLHAQDKKDSVYEKGMSIIKKEGVEAGLNFFEENAIKTGSYTSLFGQAWGYWVKGDLSQAESIATHIIYKKPRPILVAHSHYLNGHIKASKGQLVESSESFKSALSFYSKARKYADEFRTHLGLAGVHITLKEMDKAESHLNSALIVNEKAGENLGQYFYLRSKMAFGRGDYSDALRFSRESHQQYVAIEDEGSIANALSDIGFYLLLLGNIEDGLKKTDEAYAIIKKLKLVKWSYYNSINYILGYRCSGIEYESIQEKVEEWLEEKEDENLNELLTFVLEWNCN